MTTGCLKAAEFHCQTTADCVRSDGPGRCETNGFCSFADGSCASGSRFGEASGPVTNQCVGDQLIDAGIDVPAGSFTVGGTISGLSGSVTLRDNNANDLTRSSDGGFTFTTGIPDGQHYAVTVETAPAGQTCAIANASGTINGANVTDVAV